MTTYLIKLTTDKDLDYILNLISNDDNIVDLEVSDWWDDNGDK